MDLVLDLELKGNLNVGLYSHKNFWENKLVTGKLTRFDYGNIYMIVCDMVQNQCRSLYAYYDEQKRKTYQHQTRFTLILLLEMYFPTVLCEVIAPFVI